jgi:dihydrofolate synthase/folylpolyglutamate synthase
MSYSETIQYLYNLQKYGIKFGLDNIRRLTAAFNHPHTTYGSIHVGGTNGKGSTSALIASILEHAGFRVGLFTSPHLVSFTERIKVNGEEIAEHNVIELAEVVRDVVIRGEDFSPTFFEIVVMMAMLYFERKQVDLAVFEVGMGGRFDATNIITPLVSVITNIDYDHKEFLGDTLKEIAREKAGIIKPGVPVVTSSQEHEAMEVLKSIALENNAKLSMFGEEFWSFLKRETISEMCFDYHSKNSFEIHELTLPLAGEYQMQNASVAIKAVTVAVDRLQFGTLQNQKDRVTSAIRDGLIAIQWPGRLEMIQESPPIIIDGAHNPAAARALSNVLQRNFLARYKNIILVLGIMADKDVRGIMEPLLPLASEIILTAPAYSRATTPENLSSIAASLGFFHVRIARTVRDAIDMAKTIAARELRNGTLNPGPRQPEAVQAEIPLIVITGSFYTIGEAKEVIGTKGILSRLRE